MMSWIILFPKRMNQWDHLPQIYWSFISLISSWREPGKWIVFFSTVLHMRKICSDICNVINLDLNLDINLDFCRETSCYMQTIHYRRFPGGSDHPGGATGTSKVSGRLRLWWNICEITQFFKRLHIPIGSRWAGSESITCEWCICNLKRMARWGKL